MPKDPSNKTAISLHYYFPSESYENFELIPNIFCDKYGNEYTTNPIIKWGSDNDYEELYNKLNILKNVFTDKGIPIIIGETGIITSHNNISYFREFIYAFFSLFSDFDGIMACLWDSTKYSENMYYYNREIGKWNEKY